MTRFHGYTSTGTGVTNGSLFWPSIATNGENSCIATGCPGCPCVERRQQSQEIDNPPENDFLKENPLTFLGHLQTQVYDWQVCEQRPGESSQLIGSQDPASRNEHVVSAQTTQAGRTSPFCTADVRNVLWPDASCQVQEIVCDFG